MSFGLRTFSSTGVMELDTTSFTYQILHNELLDFTATTTPRTISIPGFDPDKCSAVLLPIDAVDDSNRDTHATAMPYISLAPGVVTVLSRHPNETDSRFVTLIRVRLLVMRFRN
ncbi:hypothetical protein [Pseudomonas wadenswilerensis]|uniref:Prophage PssSM-03 n=1 Tax=Pseudomonas wadenswilerensis TaxID=1785161 RepID=A0A380SZH0_9PSED|nr:hypothetical protein [Pseudomonas wadenswilerensis]SUQ62710.1 Prophage PssSM-03 [Pseudomonas wadenswilerensis]